MLESNNDPSTSRPLPPSSLSLCDSLLFLIDDESQALLLASIMRWSRVELPVSSPSPPRHERCRRCFRSAYPLHAALPGTAPDAAHILTVPLVVLFALLLLSAALSNPSPLLLHPSSEDEPPPLSDPALDGLRDELFSLIRRIQDPEHHHSLEQLGVVRKAHISFLHGQGETAVEQVSQASEATSAHAGEGEGDESDVVAVVEFTPTVPHCSLATTIGLCIRARVLSSIPDLKVCVNSTP